MSSQLPMSTDHSEDTRQSRSLSSWVPERCSRSWKSNWLFLPSTSLRPGQGRLGLPRAVLEFTARGRISSFDSTWRLNSSISAGLCRSASLVFCCVPQVMAKLYVHRFYFFRAQAKCSGLADVHLGSAWSAYHLRSWQSSTKGLKEALTGSGIKSDESIR